MPKYVFFSLTSDSLARLMEHPEDRRGPVQQLAAAAGGRLEDFYWMLGPYDGLAVVELPDSAAAASVAVTVVGSGAFKHFETHELLAADQFVGILQKAKTLQASYQSPGQVRT